MKWIYRRPYYKKPYYRRSYFKRPSSSSFDTFLFILFGIITAIIFGLQLVVEIFVAVFAELTKLSKYLISQYSLIPHSVSYLFIFLVVILCGFIIYKMLKSTAPSNFNISTNIEKNTEVDRRTDSQGYVIVGNNKYEHRLVAEVQLGRKLFHNEIVHHINGKPGDNRVENLCVMDRMEHEHFHAWLDWCNKKRKYPTEHVKRDALKNKYKGILL